MKTANVQGAIAVPEATSARGFARFVGGKCLKFGRGEAWRDVKAYILELPSRADTVHLPSVSESSLAWTFSGDVEFQEREGDQPWITNRIQKGTFFLTSGGAPYDVRWKSLSGEPFQSMAIFLELPVLHRAMEEVFGADAIHARLRDVSAFSDTTLSSLMERLRDELMGRRASPLFVGGVAQAIAVHLARHYAEIDPASRTGSPSLPGYKLRQIKDWMSENLAEEFHLDQLAGQVGLSKFYFNRLFKSALGVSPSQYHITLRMEEAQRLLRETRRTIVDVAMDVGYANPSHFARAFRKATGLSPSDYRQQR